VEAFSTLTIRELKGKPSKLEENLIPEMPSRLLFETEPF